MPRIEGPYPTLNDLRNLRQDPVSRIGMHRVTDAAMLIGLNPRTIWRSIKAGQIPAYGYKGRLRVRLEDVLPAYLPKVQEKAQKSRKTRSPQAESPLTRR